METLIVTITHTGPQHDVTDELNETLNLLEAAGAVLDWTYTSRPIGASHGTGR